ncbi:MAG: DUF2500 domain-containing protein [Butyricicoccus sp.]|nr:DUF2500 domain-containing protein [Butyricicoccus sp.]
MGYVGGFYGGFNAMRILFLFVFGLVIAVFVVVIVKGLGQWSRNNNSPRLTVPAFVTAKRTNVSHHHHAGNIGAMHSTSSTSYYVTFQFESGDRLELHVSGPEYGLLAEGDRGMLSFQGTRYLSFERDMNY